MRAHICIHALLVLAVSFSAWGSSSLAKKLIVTGWDSPNTSQFRRDLKAMEKWPFAGAVIYAEGAENDGKRFDARLVFSTNHWERSFFSSALADLKAAHSSKLTDNFLLCGANPGYVDWFDDAGWKEIENHWRILAWLAHEGGLKGLLFDPEAYQEPFNQFDYGSQIGKSQHSFAEYSLKARERGDEVMNAIVSEFPNVVINCYYLFSYCTDELISGADQQVERANSTTGLLSPFADGWFDVLPSTALVIDGDEKAYHYSGAAFNDAYLQIKNDCQALVSAENRAKFRTQLQVSHGIYLDLYLKSAGAQVNPDDKGGSEGKNLEDDVLCALAATDEYVWVYGQKARWWPPSHIGPPAPSTWPVIFTGVDLDLLSALNPSEGARRRLAELRKRSSDTNLVTNGDFISSRAGYPYRWGTHQTTDSHGHFNLDPNVGASVKGSACLSAVKSGCFMQAIKVRAGQKVVLSAKVLKSGVGAPWLRVRWENANGMSVEKSRDAGFGASAEAGFLTWRDIVGTVVVPEGASQLVLRLGVTGQRTVEDRVWFDDVLAATWED